MTVNFDSGVDFKVQFGFGVNPLSTGTSWSDVSTSVRAVAIDRGRLDVLGRFEAGTATVTLDNRTGKFDPSNTGSTFSPNVKVGTPVRIQGIHGGTTYDLFRGTAEGWPLRYPDKGHDAVATPPLVDDFKLIALDDVGGTTYAEELPNVRIGNVLDNIGWPSSRRALDTGLATMAASTGVAADTRGLQYIQTVAESDVGVVYMSGAGDVTFHTRIHFAGGSTSQATFGHDSTDLPYQDIVVRYDDDFLWNEARVTRENGTEQTASDTGSIDSYGPRVLTRPDQLMSNDPEALNIAEWLRNIYHEVNVRVESIDLDPRTDTGLWPQVLGRELRDSITVKLVRGGSTLSQEVSIEAISHTWTREKTWETTWQLAPLTTGETDSVWILGSSSFSQLDQTTRLA